MLIIVLPRVNDWIWLSLASLLLVFWSWQADANHINHGWGDGSGWLALLYSLLLLPLTPSVIILLAAGRKELAPGRSLARGLVLTGLIYHTIISLLLILLVLGFFL